jgi:hypothetical protein
VPFKKVKYLDDEELGWHLLIDEFVLQILLGNLNTSNLSLGPD